MGLTSLNSDCVTSEMRLGDLVRVTVYESRDGIRMNRAVTGIIVHIEESQVYDDGPVSPILSVLTSQGFVEVLSNQANVINEVEVLHENR